MRGERIVAKKDGEKIVIKFSQPITSDVTENANAFTVTIKEYDMVPNGTLHESVRAVESVSAYSGFSENLDFKSGVLVDAVVDNGQLKIAEA